MENNLGRSSFVDYLGNALGGDLGNNLRGRLGSGLGGNLQSYLGGCLLFNDQELFDFGPKFKEVDAGIESANVVRTVL